MAANPAANNSESSNSARTRAVNLLRIVTNLLSDGNTAQDEAPAESSAVVASVPRGETHHTTEVAAMPNVRSAPGETREVAAMRNFRNLFSGYRSAPSMHAGPPPSKRVKRGFFVPKDTWTLDFFCLADTRCDTVPSRQEKMELQAAGLGRKRVVFASKDNAVLMQRKLEDEFPN